MCVNGMVQLTLVERFVDGIEGVHVLAAMAGWWWVVAWWLFWWWMVGVVGWRAGGWRAV